MPEQRRAYPIAGASARESAASVEAAIEAGSLAPGEALPSVRSLAGRLGVSPGTVAAAVREVPTPGAVAGGRRRAHGRGVVAAGRPPGGGRAAPPPVQHANGGLVVPAGARDVS